jgi:hypothetical protein
MKLNDAVHSGNRLFRKVGAWSQKSVIFILYRARYLRDHTTGMLTVILSSVRGFYSRQRQRFILNFKTVWPCIVIDSLRIKPTDALSSNFFGITTLHVSDSLSAHHQEFLAVHRHWYTLCSLVALVHFMQFGDRLLTGAGCSILCLLASVGFIHKKFILKCYAVSIGT